MLIITLVFAEQNLSIGLSLVFFWFVFCLFFPITLNPFRAYFTCEIYLISGRSSLCIKASEILASSIYARKRSISHR
jgi:hypothetical protein